MRGVRGFALVLLFALVSGEPESYDGHKLYKAYPKDNEDVNFLDNLLKTGEDGIDFWTYPNKSLDPVEINVDPTAVQKLEGLLNGAGISFTVSQQEDLEQTIEQEKSSARDWGFDGA